MTAPEVLDIGREAIWVLIQMCAPAMVVALVVGTVIGLLQALTQIQESTLVFVPKIVAVFVAIVIFMPFMGAALFSFTEAIFQRIAHGQRLEFLEIVEAVVEDRRRFIAAIAEFRAVDNDLLGGRRCLVRAFRGRRRVLCGCGVRRHGCDI